MQRQSFGVIAQFRRRRGLPLTRTQHGAQIIKLIARRARGRHALAQRTGAQPEFQRILANPALTAQVLQQPVARAPGGNPVPWH